MALKIAPQAISDIRAVASWWKSNRPAAPRLLRDELRLALRLLVERPHAGASATKARDIPRVFLRGTRYFLYYSVHEGDIEVLRLWHASRGKKPKL